MLETTIPRYHGPSIIEFASIQMRIKSFETCLNNLINPEIFSEAGFFHLCGYDTLQCFSCGLILLSWQENDCPWGEHIKYSTGCSHLYLNKVSDWSQLLRSKHFGSHSDEKKSKLGPECIICLDKNRGVCFYPCEHLLVCTNCAAANTNCPLCRSEIHFAVRVAIA